MAEEKFKIEPMSKMERLKKNVIWAVQGFVVACVILGGAFLAVAGYGAVSGSIGPHANAFAYAADFLFSGFVLAILLAGVIVPNLLSSLSSEAGLLRTGGAIIGIILVMGLMTEIMPQ